MQHSTSSVVLPEGILAMSQAGHTCQHDFIASAVTLITVTARLYELAGGAGLSNLEEAHYRASTAADQPGISSLYSSVFFFFIIEDSFTPHQQVSRWCCPGVTL